MIEQRVSGGCRAGCAFLKRAARELRDRQLAPLCFCKLQATSPEQLANQGARWWFNVRNLSDYATSMIGLCQEGKSLNSGTRER
jgi:hypothetical protein